VEAMLSANRFQYHTDSEVIGIQRRESKVQLLTAEGPTLNFDHVIVATHADQSLALLGDEATETEKEILGSFSYQKNNAILHTDTSILPSNRRAWASWNYLVDQKCSEHAVVTYNMNILQGIQSDTTYCVTLNAEELIDPNQIIRKIVYHHPIFNEDRDRMQARHDEIINARSLSFCGAYWGNGFHEDGVRSGLKVVKQIQDVYGGHDG
jgi:predicted NAD/FAD-binding protein